MPHFGQIFMMDQCLSWWCLLDVIGRERGRFPACRHRGLFGCLLRDRVDLHIQALLLAHRLYQYAVMEALDVVAARINGLYVGFVLIPYYGAVLTHGGAGNVRKDARSVHAAVVEAQTLAADFVREHFVQILVKTGISRQTLQPQTADVLGEAHFEGLIVGDVIHASCLFIRRDLFPVAEFLGFVFGANSDPFSSASRTKVARVITSLP